MSDLAQSILEPYHAVRSNVQAVIATMADHGVRGVPITQQLTEAVPIIAATLMKDPNPRMKGIGAKLVLEALKHNLAVFDYANTIDRLDAGLPTERVDIEIVKRIESNPSDYAAAVALALSLSGSDKSLPPTAT